MRIKFHSHFVLRIRFFVSKLPLLLSHPQAKIICHVYRKEQSTIIEISDTGKGIPEDVKSKLFTPLFTTKSKGQGFGLAVVKL
jgi:C4-dicarboxylate-specific signal transduction histidine kinase